MSDDDLKMKKRSIKTEIKRTRENLDKDIKCVEMRYSEELKRVKTTYGKILAELGDRLDAARRQYKQKRLADLPADNPHVVYRIDDPPSREGLRLYDIVVTDHYRDVGLWFNTATELIKTPGEYHWPPEALAMFQKYNVRSYKDLKRVYGVFDLELYFIKINDTSYTLPNGPVEFEDYEEFHL
jgi:hypothetical protein